MMKWKRIPVGELANLITKGTTPTSIGHQFTPQGIPFLRVNNIQDGCLDTSDILFVSDNADTALKRSRILPNDVLISIAGTIGRSAVVPDDAPLMNCNQAVAIIRLKESTNPYYFRYWLNSQDAINQILGSKVTGTIANLSLGCINKLSISLPPLEEQKRIAAILDKADRVRRKRQEAIRLTEELGRSIFLDMFGDPVTNPKGWNFQKLGELLSEPLQNGAYYPKEQYTNFSDGTEMVHMSDAFYEKVKRGMLKRVNIAQSDIEKYGLSSNDILIARRSLTYEGAAKPCLIGESTEPLVFESSLIRVRVNQKLLDPVFLYFYLSLPPVRQTYLFPNVTKSTISGINQAGLKRVEIILPPIDIQRKFREIYDKVGEFKTRYELQHLKESENLFNSLLQRAFRGEL
jgi:type I restriction enzyme, S subunit